MMQHIPVETMTALIAMEATMLGTWILTDLGVDGMLDGSVLDRLAGMGELSAVGHQVLLQQGHILALEDVPHSPCPSVPVNHTCQELVEICICQKVFARLALRFLASWINLNVFARHIHFRKSMQSLHSASNDACPLCLLQKCNCQRCCSQGICKG